MSSPYIHGAYRHPSIYYNYPIGYSNVSRWGGYSPNYNYGNWRPNYGYQDPYYNNNRNNYYRYPHRWGQRNHRDHRDRRDRHW